MPHEDLVVISGAVEGLVDEAVLRRLTLEAGGDLQRVYGRNGKSQLRQLLSGYNRAAQFAPWVILVDLDHDAGCAPPLCANWLPYPSPQMCFRVAVREVESWLLADQQGLAGFLGVRAIHIPIQPEAVDDPKLEMVTLARRSRRRNIREDMVPRPGSGRDVGPAYTSRLIEFVQTRWRCDLAAQRSDSLRRCRERINELVTASRVGD